MSTLDRLFTQGGRKVDRSTTERSRSRAFARFKGVGVVLAFILVLTSVIFPRAGHAAFPGTNGKIAFQSDRDGNFEIYVMNADGSGQTRLTNNSVVDYLPAWSPDGTKIVITRDQAFGISQIWVINVNDLSETQLTNDAFVNHAPTWSPDGTKIAFAKAAFGGDAEVYVMNADGSGQTNLSNNQAFPDQDLDPNWSPDGTQLAFFRGGGGYSEVWKMKADGSMQTKLSTNSFVGDGLPAWSPDGTKITFLTLRDGNPEIYVMNADGSGPTRLTNNSASDSNPDWQPPYNFSGFFPPVDNPGPGPNFVFNIAKAGSAIPVKFSLSGDQGLNIFDTGFPVAQKIPCNASSSLDPIEQTTTAGSSSLSYDATTDQYVYVWKTDKGWVNSCRKLIVQLNDGTAHTAYFNFTK